MENCKKILSTFSGGKILDVGTGRGEFINFLKNTLKDYTDITGIDTTPQAIEFCKNQFKDENIQFIEMDAEKMDFNDNTFDTVCISNSLHHLPDAKKILQEMKRVLKPNGRFIISEMFCDNLTNAQMSHVLIHHWSAKIDSARGVYHDETYKRDEIIQIVDFLNLSDLQIFDYKHETEDSKSEELFKYFDDLIDKVLGRLEVEGDLYSSLEQEGKTIKDWIKDYGFESATVLMIIGSN
ncbi:class I SAM-dependent methyltransferase [Mycoplasmatota bacterium]|nr:class I SAM-dependent methyltransferase [Mycoplasmatota bacterium]